MLRPVHSCSSRIARSILLRRSATALTAQQGRLWEAHRYFQKHEKSSNELRGASSSASQEAERFSTRWHLPLLGAAGASLIGSSRCADDSDEEDDNEVPHLAVWYPDKHAHLQ